MKKKESILEVAENFFLDKGYKETTIEDIANALNIQKGGIYYYFQNKKEILETAINRQVEQFQKAIDDALQNKIGVKNQLYTYLQTRQEYLNDSTPKASFLKDDYLASIFDFINIKKDLISWEISNIKSILKKAIENKEIESTNVDILSNIVYTNIKGMEFLNIENKNDLSFEEQINMFLKILVRGLA